VKILAFHFGAQKDHIKVGIEWMVDDLVHGTSRFDLPPEFELGHVHNEADEIAEQCKEARRSFALRVGTLADKGSISERFDARGTGARGNWRRYGERTA
jgi:hypothetical protein